MTTQHLSPLTMLLSRHTRRREFITLLGGAAAWPLAARAQQTAMPVIGLLDSRSSDAMAGRLAGFRQGLKEVGFADGENVRIVYRFNSIVYQRWAADLIRQQAAVIFRTGGPASAFAAKAGNHHDSGGLSGRRRPGQIGSCQQPRATDRQSYRLQCVHCRAGGKAAGIAASVGARRRSHCRPRQPRQRVTDRGYLTRS